MKKKPKYNQNAIIRGALRRAFARSPAVQEKMAESRREVPRYLKDGTRAKKDWVQRQCEVCKEWVGSTKLAVDHIDPVVSVDDGFQDWNIFVSRLWCDKSNLQRICDDCHNLKTQGERIARLLKQYTTELDAIELEIKSVKLQIFSSSLFTTLRDKIKKYLSKKNTMGLESVVQRAKDLKTVLEEWRTNGKKCT